MCFLNFLVSQSFYPKVWCNPFTLADCDEKEQTYQKKAKAWETEKLEKEAKRLRKMFEENKASQNLPKKKRVFLEKRMLICEKLVKGEDTLKKEEL